MSLENQIPEFRPNRTRRRVAWLPLLAILLVAPAASAQRQGTETICASTLSTPDGPAELLASPLLRSIGGLLSSLELDRAPQGPSVERIDRSDRGYLVALRLGSLRERETPQCAPRRTAVRRGMRREVEN